MSENEQRQLSIAEAAGFLGVTRYTVWKYVKKGLLASTRIVGYRSRPEHRIALSDLEAFEMPKRGAKPKPRKAKKNRYDYTGITWNGTHYPTLQAAADAHVPQVSKETMRKWRKAGYTSDADVKPPGRPWHRGRNDE